MNAKLSRPWLVLAGVLLLAAGLRAWDLGGPSVWLDEALSVQRSNGHIANATHHPRGVLLTEPKDLIHLDAAEPAWRIWTALDEEVHPPLYYLTLRLWREVGFDSIVGWRALSVAASLAGLVGVFIATRQSLGDEAACWAAGLLAVAGPQIVQAQSARSYALLMAIALGSAAVAAAIAYRGATWPRLTALGVLLLATPLVHYAGLFLAAAVGTWTILAVERRDRRRVILAVAVAAAVFAAAWGPMLLRQHAADMDEHLRFVAGSGDKTLSRLRALPVKIVADVDRRGFASVGAVAMWMLVGWVGVTLWRKRWRGVLLWTLLLVAAVGPVVASDLLRDTRGMSYPRYLYPAGVPLLVLVAASVTLTRSRWRHTLPAAVAVAAVSLLPRAHAPANPPWREVAARVGAVQKPGDLLVIQGEGLRYWRLEAAHVLLSIEGDATGRPVFFADEPAPLPAGFEGPS